MNTQDYTSMFHERKAGPPCDGSYHVGTLYTVNGRLTFEIIPPIQYPINTTVTHERNLGRILIGKELK